MEAAQVELGLAELLKQLLLLVSAPLAPSVERRTRKKKFNLSSELFFELNILDRKIK